MRTGRCLCGSVRLTADRIEPKVSACHCKMCQRWAGGPFLAVTVPAGSATWEGREHVGTHQSSEWAERAWCIRCGSALWFRVTGPGDPSGGTLGEHEVPVGLLDDTDGLSFEREIFVDAKPRAYSFAGDHRRLTEAETLMQPFDRE